MESLVSILLFSAGTFQGLLLIFYLFSRTGKFIPNVILSLFIGVLMLQAFARFADIYFASVNIGPVYNISYFLPYLYGPLSYLYIRKSIVLKPTLRIIELVHLIPFLISVMIVLFSGYGIIRFFEYVNVHVYNIADTFVQLGILGSYAYFCRRMLKNQDGLLNAGFRKSVEWLRKLSNIVTLSGICSILLLTFYFYNREFNFVDFEYSVHIFSFLPLVIYWLALNTMRHPDLFFEPAAVAATVNSGIRNYRYQGSRLEQDQIVQITHALNRIMSTERSFLDPRLTLEHLSKLINYPKHSVSRVINESMGTNYNDYINRYRIDYAKHELVNKTKQNLTIAAIAYESGFNSISTFNEAFKKFTGKTPSEFKKCTKTGV